MPRVPRPCRAPSRCPVCIIAAVGLNRTIRYGGGWAESEQGRGHGSEGPERVVASETGVAIALGTLRSWETQIARQDL